VGKRNDLILICAIEDSPWIYQLLLISHFKSFSNYFKAK
jgi:hypothetical protein